MSTSGSLPLLSPGCMAAGITYEEILGPAARRGPGTFHGLPAYLRVAGGAYSTCTFASFTSFANFSVSVRICEAI